jgi:16S rRNA A1518/A1519 N6-dimethyltransferase RsmA/KsgA/DIM1 with predicted DNA glycosylase/AP lyase activity
MLLRLLYKFRWLILFVAFISTLIILNFSNFHLKEQISLTGLIIVGCSLLFTFISIEGSERTFTYSICSDWYKTELNKNHVNIYYFTPKSEIESLLQRFEDKKLQPSDEDKFQKIVSILNYLETLATFYFDNKLDKSIIRENFKHIIRGYYEKFKILIDDEKVNSEDETLKNFVRLYYEFLN